MDGITHEGLAVLPWTKKLRAWQARAVFFKRLESDDRFFDFTDKALVETMEIWLGPYLYGISNVSQLQKIDLKAALFSLLTWDQLQKIETRAPSHFTVPSGSRIPLNYTISKNRAPDPPVLAVRLQEMFGLRETPGIAGGRVPLILHLLSPAGRPIQITQDLESFWRNTYLAVKKDLKGRYPKHYWPDDPLAAMPTARTKPKHRP